MADHKPVTAYLLAVGNHLAECEADIAMLGAILADRPWSRLERHAAERTLQILIESCIGLAKHWVKRETGVPINEPTSAFELLEDYGLIDHKSAPPVPWRKVIGLRNALVHDYLVVDDAIVQDVIQSKHYDALLRFGRQAITAMSE